MILKYVTLNLRTSYGLYAYFGPLQIDSFFDASFFKELSLNIYFLSFQPLFLLLLVTNEEKAVNFRALVVANVASISNSMYISACVLG